MTYKTILADPPWPEHGGGKSKRGADRHYPLMSVRKIAALPVGDLATDDAHLWLWTTNAFLRDGFDMLDAWGFTYLAPIHWTKPAGVGAWFVHLSQTLLFGYRKRCCFHAARMRPNLIATSNPVRHSEKPQATYDYIEAISIEPRVELFARKPRAGWTVFGNEVNGGQDIRAALAGGI